MPKRKSKSTHKASLDQQESMLYYLISYLEKTFQPPGFQVVQFTTVRASLAAITALLISLFVGRAIISWLERKQIGETVREGVVAGAVDHTHKSGTPTMGGLIILLAVLGSTILWGAIAEVYVWLILLATTWMGAFGFADEAFERLRFDEIDRGADAGDAVDLAGDLVAEILHLLHLVGQVLRADLDRDGQFVHRARARNLD